MAVYVDDACIPFGRMKMCHMAADTVEELHAMADQIGVQRRWYQGPPKTMRPHYDICLSKRRLAIMHGALERCPRDILWAARRCCERETREARS